MKTCRDCREELPLDAFQRYWHNRQQTYRYSSMCKPCRGVSRRANSAEKQRGNERSRARYAADPDLRARILSQGTKYRYGITNDQKDAMLAAQGGVCGSCGTNEPAGRGWVVDHDHACCAGVKSCGKCIRAILCTRCNVAVGMLRDSAEHAYFVYLYLAGLSGSTGKPELNASVVRRQPAA